MTDVENGDIQVPPAGNSMMDALRAKHRRITESLTKDIALPGYDGVLVARYRVLDFQQEIAKIGKRVEVEFKTQAEQALYGAIDTMVLACKELGMWDRDSEEDDHFVSYQSIIGLDAPVRYGPSLVEAMGWEKIDTARDVVFKVFGGVETMILGHGAQLNAWFGNVTGDQSETFLGGLMR